MTTYNEESVWDMPPAEENTVLMVRAFSCKGKSRGVLALVQEGRWTALDFDRRRYIPLTTFLRDYDGYSIEQKPLLQEVVSQSN
ncbi:MAG TPA: hypothetical protein PK765_02795 [bacterium]|nr:hypothetical protein [bacterium]